MNEQNDIVLSITAHIDLLGFSSHLELANNDLRSTIGEAATKRLETIENSINLLEKERKKFPHLYPKEFAFIRFNDSLFLSMSVAQHIIPESGSTDVGGYRFDDVMSKVTHEKDNVIRSEDLTKQYAIKYGDEGKEVAKFVGLVARVHEYINKIEDKSDFPGPRTIISTGLRRKFFTTDINGQKEDFFSANFSLSNAYIVNEKGSKVGINGNKIFVEDNIARIIAYNEKYKSLMVLSKFILNHRYYDPYEEYLSDSATKLDILIEKPIPIDLFGKKYTFRELNSCALTNLQLLPVLEEYFNDKKQDNNSYPSFLIKALKNEIPSLEQIRNVKSFGAAFPLLCMSFKLGDLEKDLDIIFREND